jgi:predicted amidophosphoribosyltransferase
MDTQQSLDHGDASPPKNGFRACPHCGFKVPENLGFCWQCGEKLTPRKKRF